MSGFIQGEDRFQATLFPECLDDEALTAAADRGYYPSEDIQECEKANITSYLPKPNTSGNRAKGQFGRDAESLDGIDSVFDQNARPGEYRDESANQIIHISLQTKIQ
jgi:hypothetical protein